MKNFFILLVVFLLLTESLQSQTFTYAGKHDSVLFDGADGYFINSDDDCAVEIIVSGTVEASVKVKDLVWGCNQAPESTYVWKKRIVKTGDRVNLGEEIKTGPDGFAQISLSDGSVIMLKKNTAVVMDKAICEQASKINIIFGGIWTRIKKSLGGGKYEAVTPRYIIGVRGTEFTLETAENEDIVKVFEGSVDANPRVGVIEKHFNTFQEKLNKINDDYQSGKITVDEYVQNMDDFNKEVEDIQNNAFISVGAGQKCTIDLDGNIKGPVPIDPGDDKWFENVFK